MCATRGGGRKHSWPLSKLTFDSVGLHVPPVVAVASVAGQLAIGNVNNDFFLFLLRALPFTLLGDTQEADFLWALII